MRDGRHNHQPWNDSPDAARPFAHEHHDSREYGKKAVALVTACVKRTKKSNEVLFDSDDAESYDVGRSFPNCSFITAGATIGLWSLRGIYDHSRNKRRVEDRGRIP
jgi:hypothetical protein